uniref:Uncharacterized protein n=1 Tax=uncultured Thiotrichaceae bacterium TaxID=298394 RepID=A0A6S6UA03_9GAMM|nr:MAG: Unknown protein [uncultured Thiotrichaceae bacterium]
MDTQDNKAVDTTSSFDDLMMDMPITPTAEVEAQEIAIPDTTPKQDLPAIPATSSEILIELCGSISSHVDELGLEEVNKKTITYVDNDNKNVLLVNKFLIATGRTPIPIISPSLAPHFMTKVATVDILQGDILLYADDDGAPTLGILTSTVNNKTPLTAYKVLTTVGENIQTAVVAFEKVNSVLR